MNAFEKWFEGICQELFPVKGNRLSEAVHYSLFSGGKRFRPQLALEVVKACDVEIASVFPWAGAVEMIHTYSLIHDDLPCMDDDDERRGKPTNHKVFGEAVALLAGDALLTEAFFILAQGYFRQPELGLRLTRVLSEAAGLRGMVGGQAQDLRFQEEGGGTREEILEMHRKKTGALIAVSVYGAAMVAGVSRAEEEVLLEFGQGIGEAFQLADDLLDSTEVTEKGSLIELVGVKETYQKLEEVTDRARMSVSRLSLKNSGLVQLLDQNLKRAPRPV